MLSHMVYFTLKDRSPAAVQKLVDACQKYLTGHPGTVFFAAGTLVPDLTRPVNQVDFDLSWKSNPVVNREPKTEFAFKGLTISAVVHSDPSAPWPSPDFRETFSAIIRRLDRSCNIRWI